MPRLPEQFRLLIKPNLGWYALVAAIGLTWIGIKAIETVAPQLAATQLFFWLPIALLAMAICLLPHPRALGLASFPFMAVMTTLLIVVILPGMPKWLVPDIYGARSWFNLYFMRFQPSELAKIAFVLSLAWHLRYRKSYRTLLGLLVPFSIMLVPVLLIFLEPDLGSALLFAPVLFAVLVAAGVRLRHLGALVGIAVVVVVINIALIYFLPPTKHPFLRPHQIVRITSAFDRSDVHDDAYQQLMAMNLTGAGQVYGYGYKRSATIFKYVLLPENHNDMIFAVIVNRWGLVGGLATLALYVMLAISFAMVALRSKDPFARLATVGFSAMIFTQAMINIAVTIGLLPVTGITLPFISYGGSSLLSTFAMVGVVINFASRRSKLFIRPSVEYDRV